MTNSYPIEAVIQLERDDCRVTQEVSKLKNVKSITRLKIESEETLHVIEKDEFTPEDMHTLNKLSDKVTKNGTSKVWIFGKSCSACKAMAMSDAVLVSSKSVDSKRVMFRVILENRVSLKKLIKYLEEKDLNPTVLEGPDELRNEVSDREFNILKVCYDLGYFENDRGASLTDIAKILGISTSSLSETLRRAMKKTVKDFLSRKNP
jgi:predicted DNA binding protein